MPKVSIVVPVYNVEQYLKECIDSILIQSYKDFELILVDDGSTDQSGMICDQYKQIDSRIIVLHKENGGVSAARNYALERVSGEYILFCDSDDYISSNWLSKLVETMKNYNADQVIGNYKKVCEEEEEIGHSDHECGTYNIANLEDKVIYCFDKIFGNKHGWEICLRIFKTDIIKKHHIRFCETCGNFAEDLGFILEYSLYAKTIVSIPSEGYYYRVRIGSMMVSSKTIVKLNSVNEVSMSFIRAYKKKVNSIDELNVLPIFHFLIMFNQYYKITGTTRYPYLHNELKQINNIVEWKYYTKKIFRCYKQLKKYFGKYNARRILLLSQYCLYDNWRIFRVESMLLYKFTKPESVG